MLYHGAYDSKRPRFNESHQICKPIVEISFLASSAQHV